MDIQQNARIAGLFYLIVVLTGIFNLAYVPSVLIAVGNPSQTFQNISSNHNQLFRLGIASSMLCYLFFLALAIALYRTFIGISKFYSQVMFVLVVVGVCLSLTALSHKFSILELIFDRKYFSCFKPDCLQDQVILHLRNYNWSLVIAKLFWGLWLLPLGWLILKSKYLSKILGVLLILGCIGYLTNAFGSVLFKDFNKSIVADYILLF